MKVPDNENRLFEYKDITLVACGVDEDGNVTNVDVLINGRFAYCLPINETENPYSLALAHIFAGLTDEKRGSL